MAISTTRASSQPSPTLYVQNLDDKIKKSDLQRLLYQLFLTHGKVLDVVVKKGNMRGQAFVVFRDVQGATQAMRYLDGTGFLDRDLKITYARTQSHATIRETVGEEVLYHVKLGLKDPNTLQDINPKMTGKLTVSGAQAANLEKKRADEIAAKKRLHGSTSDSEHEDDDAEYPSGPAGSFQSASQSNSKKTKFNHPNDEDDDEEAMEEDSDSEQPVDSAAAAAVKAAGSAPILSGEDPNPVLFLEGLPAEVTDDMMAVLFQQYPGFQSVRLVPGRTGIAFVQYDTAAQSDMAKAALDGFKLAPGVVMKVGFARRG
ncbi:hypothetical protein O181_004791 [Austropuccinia psidii MF-1]|uniref:RRM domain-containing protein n=1 Tax=Austropuccinia psidii MF-1 TaxID=1389203 RepID=A0A9Q3BG82_9BASI|nr:hypothetical protein [Austropuccinia psidii MF-1]